MKNSLSAFAQAAAVAGLALTSFAVLPTPTARAADPVSTPNMLTHIGANGFGTGCTTSMPFTSYTEEIPLTGAKATRTAAGLWTVYKNNASQLTVTPKITGSSSITLRNGRLDTLDLGATGGVRVDAVAGQGCGVSTDAGLSTYVDITTTRASWVTLRLSATRETDTRAEIEPVEGSDLGLSLSVSSGGGTSAATYYLPAGSYRLYGRVGWDPYLSAGEGGASLSGTGTVHVELDEVGEAIGSTAGSGARYVTLGNQVACADRGVVVRFGRKVRSATVYVDGRRVESLKKPKAGRSIFAAGLDRYRTGKVQVRLVVDPPGKRKKASVTATRTYRACDSR
ncbi:hypothetical protein ABIE44_001466 [Marmoricola sp. OAE513]|uniref:hypothetical protein n=1 Tax=Marmoricola sp. OAE513 TaxID=2817894 RepID=UPI001AE4B6F6